MGGAKAVENAQLSQGQYDQQCRLRYTHVRGRVGVGRCLGCGRQNVATKNAVRFSDCFRAHLPPLVGLS